ncbi:MAG: hypothetical protein MMC33_008700 [Icmadophila ericetorum]|nr:hypothetical protein [Icmadophila ericetorum]
MQLLWLLGLVSAISNVAYGHSQSRNQLNYLSLVENPTIQTPSHRVHALSEFDIIFNLHRKQQKIKLSLEPSHGIISDTASVNYLNENGQVVRTEAIDRSKHKIFKGDTWVELPDGSWSNVGWARVTIRRDGIDPLFEGAFTTSYDQHHIQLRSNYMATKHTLDPHLEDTEEEYMVVFRDGDIAQQTSLHKELKRSLSGDRSCEHDRMAFNTNPSHPVYSPPVLRKQEGAWGSISLNSLFARQLDTTTSGNSGGVNLSSTIGSSAGCPSTRKVALVGVATDCSYTASFASEDDTRQNVIAQFNSASAVYESTFNITLGLQNLTVSPASCPSAPTAATPWNVGCDGNATITSRLNDFSGWRGNINDTNAYWTLLTNCPTGPEVGLAWLGQLCVSGVTSGDGETVSSANVVARTSTEWQVIAHESGHTFGAVHDCDEQTCTDGTTVAAQQCCPLSDSTCDANGVYIMNPSTGPNLSQFSACTVGNICTGLLRNSVSMNCLSDNKDVTTITGAECGNGIVEGDEQCDCGDAASCANDTCCDGTTCKFKGNAICDDANDNCCTNCQFSVAGTVCRASTGTCDPAETCTGTNATCPPNKMAPNGQSCGNTTGLQCASGQCTSRDQQCKTLMGSYTEGNDTYACNSETCTVSCASPSFGPGVCYNIQQNFLDGTPCSGGGTCSNGQCTGTSIIKEVGSWISENKPLVIGLASGIGAILIFCIAACILRRCCGRGKQRRASKRSKVKGKAYPAMQESAYWPQHTGGWAGSSGQGGGYWQPQPPGQPPPIPPHYTQGGYGGYGRTSTVRYA